MSRALVPVLGLLIAVLAIGAPVAARADATVDSATVESNYPTDLVFKLTATAPDDITDIKLTYFLAGRTIRAVGFPDAFTPAKSLSVEVKVEVNVANRFIPVGSEFTYQWEITTADGSVTITPETQYRHLPPGKDWQSVENPNLRIFYYGDNEDEAEEYLAAAEDTYERIGEGLLKTTLPFTPVVIVVFPTRNELLEAQNEPSESLCGSKFSDHIIMHVLGASCGTTSVADVVRHEFAHMLNEAAGNSSISRIPSWMDEGTAVYAETSPGGFGQAYNEAARRGLLVPLAQLTPTLRDRDAGLFYGQSWAMVKYLIEEQGEDKFAELFATVKGGTRFDQAFSTVYGFDLAQFEADFLAQAGGATQQPTATPTPAPVRTVQPTAVPTRVNQPSSSSDSGSGLSTSTFVVFGVAVLFALLAVLAFLVSLILQNNRTGGGSKPAGG